MRKVLSVFVVLIAALVVTGCNGKSAPTATPAVTQPVVTSIPSVEPTPTEIPHPDIEGQWTVIESHAVHVSSISTWGLEADAGDQVAFTETMLITPYSLAIPYEWLDAEHMVLDLSDLGLALQVSLEGDTLTLHTYFGELLATMRRVR